MNVPPNFTSLRDLLLWVNRHVPDIAETTSNLSAVGEVERLRERERSREREREVEREREGEVEREREEGVCGSVWEYVGVCERVWAHGYVCVCL